jgi:biopolymer transport protein ExbB/TolQ
MFANVATLTGLMGTIYGLILAFQAVSGEGIPEADKTKFLAAGISAAMNTTIFGLMVAIPSLIIYTYLSNRTTKIIDEMDEHLVKLINLITGNR